MDNHIFGITSPSRLQAEFGIAKATAYRLLKTDPEFPRPIKLTESRTGWSRRELEDYFLSRPRRTPNKVAPNPLRAKREAEEAA